jgi:hypothetical protein
MIQKLKNKPAGMRTLATAICGLAAMSILATPTAHAAKSEGCTGGGFVISGLLNGITVPSGSTVTIPASNIGPSFQVLGKYVEFNVVSSTFGIENYLFTGAASPADITGGKRTVVFQSKAPDLKGAALASGINVSNDDGDLIIKRTGTGVSMKIQAKDCAQGGIFQMEPERTDKTPTRVTHTLASGIFYYDNPNFRAREGDFVPYKNTTQEVTARVNIGNDVSRKFVARDSTQVATRINSPTCANNITTRTGAAVVVQHCGQVAIFDVTSGGRMGFVTGEDSVEVAPPPTNCTHKCQAQNRVRGRSTVLGNPFPVPAASRLKPATP